VSRYNKVVGARPPSRRLSAGSGVWRSCRLFGEATKIRGQRKTKPELLKELAEIRRRIAQLGSLEAEQIRAEGSSRKSDEKNAFLCEESQSLSMIIGAGGILKDANASTLRKLGYTRDKVIGKCALDFVPREKREGIAAQFEKIFKGEYTPEVDLDVFAKDKTIHTLRLSPARVLSYKQDRPASILFAGMDITERRRAGERDKQHIADLTFLSEAAMALVNLSPEADIHHLIGEKLRELIGNPIVVVSSFDPASDSVYLRAVLGIGRQMESLLHILGRDPCGMSFTIDEEAKRNLIAGELRKVPGGLYELFLGDVPKPVCRALEKLLGLGDMYVMGFTAKGKLFGNTIILMRKGAQLRDRSIIQTFISQAAVALQRRQAREALAEERNLLRTVIDNLPDSIYVKDTAGRFLICNTEAARRVGATTPDAVAGKTDFDFHPDELAAQYDADEQEVVRSGQPLLNREEVVMEQTRKRTNLTSKVPLRDKDGKIVGLVGTGRDITQLKTAEDEKRCLQEQLAHAQKMEAVGTLAGGIAHEFNNINAVIIGYIDFTLQTEELSTTARRNLEVVRSSVVRGGELTKNLLAFSSKDVGKRKPLNLREVVDKALRLTKKEFTSEGIEVSVRHSMKVRPVSGDGSLLSQVVMNLVVNARHAMLKSPVKKLSVETGTKSGRPFIRVKDTGCGIPKEDVPRIFEPFFTTKGSLASGGIYDGKAHGTGLGLSVCHGIIDGHGGEIKVSSQVGKGTTLTVYLAAASESERARQRAKRVPKEDNPRIMVVDDEKEITDLLVQVLDRAGYAADGFTNPREAVKALRREQYSLAFIDLQMPEMEGVDVMERINHIPPEKRPLKVIMTGRLDSSQKDDAGLDVFGCLYKPFSNQEVLDIVKEGLATKEPLAG